MKTKELIRLLQAEDPTGEVEVCVDNIDILYVSQMPAYYDGRLEVLIRDPTAKYYNVVGAKVTSSGNKIRIYTHSIEDMLYESPELPVDTSTMGNPDLQAEYDRAIAKWREEGRQIKIDYAIQNEKRNETNNGE